MPAEMVDLLLEWRPALAGEVDSGGGTPLHFASSDGDRAIVRAILRAGPPGTVYKIEELPGRPLGPPRRGADGPPPRRRGHAGGLPRRREEANGFIMLMS